MLNIILLSLKWCTFCVVFASLWRLVQAVPFIATLISGLSAPLIVLFVSWQLGALLFRKQINSRLPRISPTNKWVFITGTN